MAFSAMERVELRRFAGYPALGAAGVPVSAGAIAFEAALTGVSTEEETQIRDTILPRLRAADEAIASAAATIDTAKAAVWTRNPNALAEAREWFAILLGSLGSLLGVELGVVAAGDNALPAIFVV